MLSTRGVREGAAPDFKLNSLKVRPAKGDSPPDGCLAGGGLGLAGSTPHPPRNSHARQNRARVGGPPLSPRRDDGNSTAHDATTDANKAKGYERTPQRRPGVLEGVGEAFSGQPPGDYP